MNINRFKEKTLQLIKKLPYWFDAKHYNNTNSTTAKFLNCYGEILQDLEDCINFAYNMCELDTFDNNDYIVKKIVVEKPTTILVNKEKMIEENKEFEFIKNSPFKRYYYYDSKHNILYLSQINNFDKVVIDGVDKTEELKEHFIWQANILDEYGLLLDMPRCEGELNKEYKERLLEYSKTKANSSKHGLSSYLGHKVKLYKVIEWVDGGVDITISEPSIINSNIYVDDKPYSLIRKTTDSSVVIYGNKEYEGVSRKIKYFYGFDIYNLCDVDKDALNNNFYNTNNTPTEHLEDIFNKVSRACPILWGICRWGEKYWLDDAYENCIYIKPTFDPDISKLKTK